MYKLLLVDDEAIIRNGIGAMLPLKEMNIHLIGVCSNAFEALEYMTDEMPDILLSDIRMPQMDGLELCEKALRKYPAMQVILLSGYDEFAYAREAMRMGVKEYILKPCDCTELRKVLERVCRDIDSMRKQVHKTMGEREESVIALSDCLMELGRKSIDRDRLSEEIQKLIEQSQNVEIFVEALARLVALAEQRLISAQWKMELLQKIFNQQSEDIITKTVEILRQIYTHREGRKPFVDSMCQYVREHYMNSDLSLKFIAENVIHMNADYIGQEFMSEMGMKFSDYLLSVRMKQARKLILHDITCPFYDVAERVGYGENPHYFSVMFKKMYKITPKEFRNKAIEEKIYTEI